MRAEVSCAILSPFLPWPDSSFPALPCANTSAPGSPCGINERWDCGVVNHSPFAEIAGVPVAVFGILGYAAIAAFALARRWWIVLLLTTGAVGFSIYLTYVEAQSWRPTASGASPRRESLRSPRWQPLRRWREAGSSAVMDCRPFAPGPGVAMSLLAEFVKAGGDRGGLRAGGHCAGRAARRA